MSRAPIARGTAAILLASALAGCGINSVPTAEETAKARWADVQNNYQRRADLIPNLVATVKAAGAQEKDILVQVTQARSAANSVQVSAADLSDPAKMEQYQRVQGAVGVSLQRLQEAYPELKSQANYTTLMSQLEGTENRITIARRDYNGAVQAYNTKIRTFPDAVGAKIFYGAKPMVPFAATTPGAETAPTVNFGNAS
ncbi:LemA family protein [Sphingomonas sp. LB2R24]|uniref:LemA family protein n=1 Tax=Sphingomonas TaxID=13687 RepID=UPI00104A1158|nr:MULTISPECIES: LemA family protein [unclassified Sphingomonas]TCQ00078.1 LemA protein [Sphingomonas sp. PP-F2F-A104-K0414]TCQ10803.1 LemA protein [Sphingomonas sp. PP-CC-3A-396]